jgi:hypothetical protein
MARNGSGTYNLLTNSWNPATNGNSATAVDWQNLINDVASALTQSLSADGQTPMTGNLNAGNNKITELAAGSATGDSLRWEQLFSQGQPANLASAATTDIGAQNTVLLNITGTTTITSFGTNYNGPRYLRFDGILTLTHNATTLILPGGANITTAAGDSAIVVPNGTPANGWRVAGYQKADGSNLFPILQIQPISASVAGNALTISASALTLDFRSTTLGSGAVTRVSGTPANLVISSGSTLGTVNAVQSDIAVLAMNNAGTLELAAVNLAGGTDLSETNLISTTAEGGAGAADSATVVYSTTARSTLAYRVIGIIRSTQATAGTWVTAPSLIQGSGGMNSGGLNVNMRLGASVASTSGTAIDFTGFPEWAKRITVMFNGVSLSGSSDILVQIGDSGGIETTGYVSGSGSSVNSTAGFIVRVGNATREASGMMQLLPVSGNSWVSSHSFALGTTADFAGGGRKTLSATFDRIRITTVNGTDTFDAGSINIMYEG